MNLVSSFISIKVKRESCYFPVVVWLPPVWQYSLKDFFSCNN